MDFNKVLEILQYVVPAIATVIGAKIINQNSLHWTVWNSRAGKILGLLVSVLDALRSPAKYKADVVPDKIKRKIVKSKSLLMLIPFVLFPLGQGCAAFQFGGDTWQESGHNTISSLMKGVDIAEKAMPVWAEICVSLEGDAAADCGRAGLVAIEILQRADDALAMARFAIQIGDEADFNAQVDKATELLRDVIRKLNEWGAF